MLLVAHICCDFGKRDCSMFSVFFFSQTRTLSCSHCYNKDSLGTCTLGVFRGSIIVCMCAPVCLIFVLGRPMFIVGPATHCLRELRLQALFQAEQECPPHYSGPDWLTLLPLWPIAKRLPILFLFFYNTNWVALILQNAEKCRVIQYPVYLFNIMSIVSIISIFV